MNLNNNDAAGGASLSDDGLDDEHMRCCDNCKTLFPVDEAHRVRWFDHTSARVCDNPKCYRTMRSAYSESLSDD